MKYTIGMTKDSSVNYSLLTITYGGHKTEKRILDTSTLGEVLTAIEQVTNQLLNKGKSNGKTK